MSQPEDQMPDATPTYGAPHQQDQPRVEEPARLGPFARLTGTLLSPGEKGDVAVAAPGRDADRAGKHCVLRVARQTRLGQFLPKADRQVC